MSLGLTDRKDLERLLSDGGDAAFEWQQTLEIQEITSGALSPDELHLVKLRYLFGYTLGQIATEVSVPLSTVADRIEKAKTKISSAFQSCSGVSLVLPLIYFDGLYSTADAGAVRMYKAVLMREEWWTDSRLMLFMATWGSSGAGE
jgi:predicted DNA-binding protein (UPF0251 family)